jgi:hypothetical protein
MTRATPKERAEFIAALAAHVNGSPERRGWLATRLMYYGAAYARIQERACNGHQKPNGDWDEQAALRDERRETKLEETITKLCEPFDCKPKFGGDPRGATIKIVVPDGYTNDWGHEGICVPTS